MPEVDVKKAVQAALAFVRDLYGQHTAEASMLEEVELSPDEGEWLITLSIDRPFANLLGGRGGWPKLKRFRVDAQTGQVSSMKIASP